MEEKIKAKVLFFIGHINEIGGVEQWIYYITKKYYKDHDITLLYSVGAYSQIKRLKQNIKCIKYKGQEIECNTAIHCYDLSLIDKIEAKEQILVIHADYEAQKIRIKIPDKIDKIYAVSELAQKSFIKTHKEQLKGREIRVLYNPLALDEPQKVLRLISATRLTKEKGEDRMRIMANRLRSAKIPFIWLIFTNEKETKKPIEGFIYMKPNLDIINYIKDADYLVQLSDTEGFAYSLVESLALGTPVITTKFPVATEMGLVDGKTGYLLNFNMNNLDVNKIYNNIPKFEYKCKHSEEEWNKILGKKSKSKYKYEDEKGYEVKSKVVTHFIEENIDAKVGTIFEVKDEERLKQLMDIKYIEEV